MTLRLPLPSVLVLLAALWAAPAAAQATCPDGDAPRGVLGIGLIHCLGGACALDLWTGEGSRTHDFSTEPRVWYLDADGPAAGRLQEGDVIVWIDGALITSREGGRRAANLRPGVPVKMGVRRGGHDVEVRMTPVAGCQPPDLVVNADPSRPARPGADAERKPAVRLGINLACGDCGWRLTDDGWRFVASEELRIEWVAPTGPAGRAGLEPGDVILRIGGRPLTAPGGGRYMNSLRPGQSVTVDVRRNGRVMSMRLTLAGD